MGDHASHILQVVDTMMEMMMELDETGGRKKETEGCPNGNGCRWIPTLPLTHGTFKCIVFAHIVVCSVFGQGHCASLW